MRKVQQSVESFPILHDPCAPERMRPSPGDSRQAATFGLKAKTVRAAPGGKGARGPSGPQEGVCTSLSSRSLGAARNEKSSQQRCPGHAALGECPCVPGAGGQLVGAFPQNSTFRNQGEPVRKVHTVSRRPQDVQMLPAHEDGRPAGCPSGPGRHTDHWLPAPRPRPWWTFGTEVVRSHAGVATATSSLRTAPHICSPSGLRLDRATAPSETGHRVRGDAQRTY